MSLQIYTDGSCLGNPGPGGWGYCVVRGSKKIAEASAAAQHTTNNRMEMLAMIQALNWLTKNPEAEAEIISDSRLLINTITKNWKKKANTDLWESLDQHLRILTAAGIRPKFKWTKAHVGTKWNEHVDDLAREAAASISREIGGVPLSAAGSRKAAPVRSPKNQPTLNLTDESQDKLRSKITETQFTCTNCGATTTGVLSQKTKSGPVRVDCAECGKYVKFAKKS